MATFGAPDPTNARRCPAPAAPPLPDRVVLPVGCMFLDFHLAGGDNDELMRYSLIDRVHRHHKYVGICDGVILMAPGSFNSAGGGASVLLSGRQRRRGGAASTARERPLPRRSVRVRPVAQSPQAPAGTAVREERYYSPGPDDERIAAAANQQQQRLRSVLSGLDAKINGSSVCLDGKSYLLADNTRVLAFDVDDETVAAIDLPAPPAASTRHRSSWRSRAACAWRRAPAPSYPCGCSPQTAVIACGSATSGAAAPSPPRACSPAHGTAAGVLLLYFRYDGSSKTAYLHLYDTRTEKELARVVVPRSVAAEQGGSGLVLCSGYRPTLVPPGSIGGGGAAPRRQRGVLAALKPLIERDVAAGRERTLEAVCFMNLLHYIASKLPGNADDVMKANGEHCHSLCDDICCTYRLLL
ncbi:unnamed protein product [Urochloa decumbens]|uniref:Cleavage/polyadenylation specificity factor A subunit C-terminal domain-containing protein n=1 Tax=Urochloa decumbens TaxID=240449 RepID=A0ABC9F5X7_9POAL